MSDNLRKNFIAIAEHDIRRPGIDRLLEYLKKSDFFEAPASTRYHGSYAGGLVQHSLDVYDCLHNELEFIYGPNYLQVYSEETIAIVSLFHDLCKIDRYISGTRNVKDPVTKQWHEEPVYMMNPEKVDMGHGPASVILIQKFLMLTDEEAQAIVWHMGAFDISNYMTLNGLSSAFENNTLAFALHSADMKATYIVDNEKFVPAPEGDESIDDKQPAGELDDVVDAEQEHAPGSTRQSLRDKDSNEEAENATAHNEHQSSHADNSEDNVPEDEEGRTSTNSDESVEFHAEDYAEWSIDEIKDEIREWGGEPKKRAKRSELLNQLRGLMDSEVPF